ncbi:cysteine--tRNA ligase [Candidatus Uhrbacteria bacterium]|nr:cysteine--tRNA ligase [Candidatus Uhrbacteria bacterium]
MLQLWNSLTKTVEPFRPLKGRTVRLYTCGPTVYDFAHIGNLRSYLFEDVLKRVLLANGYRVRHVMNITDVGHLTQDSDDGEDKMERAAATANKSARQLAAFYTRAFLKDLKRLNIQLPDVMPRATQYISEQIALVRRLERRGYAYTTSDGVYFDTAKFPAYGRAFTHSPSSPLTLRGETDTVPPPNVRGGQEGLLDHSRITVNLEKRSPHDFALWKITPPGVKRQMEWDAPWGRGFPGWHIECSAMGRDLLGQPFDIHCGGIDHISIHHTNEIAQSEAAYGTPLAHVWMHGAFLTVNGGRMGKSEGNLVTMDEVIRRGLEPLAYRYLCLGAHYRSSLNFTWESLSGAQSALKKLREYCRTLPKCRMQNAECKMPDVWSGDGAAIIDRLRAAFNDDLDTPKALAVLWESFKLQAASFKPDELSAIISYADQVLGLELTRYLGKRVRIPREILALAEQREAARRAKDWARADVLRAQVGALGWTIEDTSAGPIVKRAS